MKQAKATRDFFLFYIFFAPQTYLIEVNILDTRLPVGKGKGREGKLVMGPTHCPWVSLRVFASYAISVMRTASRVTDTGFPLIWK